MNAVPPGWEPEAHALWASGQRRAAIDRTLAELNRRLPDEPRAHYVQIAYYAFLSGDHAEAARFLRMTLDKHGREPEIEKNVATALLRAGACDEAIRVGVEAERAHGGTPELYDTLADLHYRTGRLAEAKTYGEKSLRAKDERASARHARLAPLRRRERSAAAGKDVVAFSLWGDAPRYLRGCLRNAMLMGDIYPGWTMRVYAGDDVPSAFLDALAPYGVEVVPRPASEPVLARLAWRFEAANDPEVGRFLVRDADSVVSLREANAVFDWIGSGASFHVMRDWWTHTDLILAGMWGGVAGLLLNVRSALATYRPAFAETPNIDQWFLGDVVWPLIRNDVRIHDRCFDVFGASRWPGPNPGWTDGHVGQDEFTARRAYQDVVLADAVARLPCLRSATR